MTHTFDNPFEQQEARRPWGAYGAGALLLVLIALGIWRLVGTQGVTIKKEEPVSQLMSVAPPPPTPPPPKPQEQPKEQPTPAPQQQPQEQPKAPAPANNAITQNADAQAGPGDAFNIGAGNGQGMTGGGGAGLFNAAAFKVYLGGVVRETIKKDDTVQNKSFRVALSIWLSPDGKITKAVLHNSTGSDANDAALIALLLAMAPLSQRPAQQVLAMLPVEMTIDLRKSL
jgi:TonB family protein